MPATGAMAATTDPVCAIAHQHPPAATIVRTRAKRALRRFIGSMLVGPRLADRGHSLAHDEVDAKLPQCRGRSPRIARGAARRLAGALESIGAHHGGIDGEEKRGIGRAGMGAD